MTLRGLPPSRIAAAALIATAGVASVILLNGGDHANGTLARAAAGKWRALPPSPFSRTEVGAARIGGFIYAVGGFEQGLSTTDKVARYEIATGDWEVLDPLPIGVNHPGTAAYRGRLYVHGGYTDSGDEVDVLQCFDPASGAWVTLAPSGFPRAAGTLAVLGKRIYSIGGVEDGTPLALVQAYDPRRDQWTARPPMGVAREHLASAVIETKQGPRVFALGGRSSGKSLSNVESYSPKAREWRTEAPLLVAHSGFAAATVKNRVIVAGGEELMPGGSTIEQVELYRQERKRWRLLPEMITPRHGHGVVASGRILFTVEGGPQPGGAFSAVLEAIKLTRRQLGRR